MNNDEFIARYFSLPPDDQDALFADLGAMALAHDYNEAVLREWRESPAPGVPLVLGDSVGVVTVTVAAHSPLVLRRIAARTMERPVPARVITGVGVFASAFTPTYLILEPLFELFLRG